jgi:hypothetical protein
MNRSNGYTICFDTLHYVLVSLVYAQTCSGLSFPFSFSVPRSVPASAVLHGTSEGFASKNVTHVLFVVLQTYDKKVAILGKEVFVERLLPRPLSLQLPGTVPLTVPNSTFISVMTPFMTHAKMVFSNLPLSIMTNNKTSMMHRLCHRFSISTATN